MLGTKAHPRPAISSQGKRRAFFYGWVIVAVVFTSLIFGYGIRNTFSVFFPAIVEEFHWERGGTAFMYSLNLLVYGLVSLGAGNLVDRFGPRAVLPAGAVIAGCAIAFASLAGTLWQFYLVYGVLAAAGMGLMGWTPISAVLSRWFMRKRGLAFGIVVSGFGVSLVLTPAVQALISGLGWRSAYIVIGIATIVFVVPPCVFLLRRNPAAMGLHPDGLPPIVPLEVPLQTPGADNDWTLAKAVRTPHFWLLALTSFCLTGTAEQIAVAHQVYFYIERGIRAHRRPISTAYLASCS